MEFFWHVNINLEKFSLLNLLNTFILLSIIYYLNTYNLSILRETNC